MIDLHKELKGTFEIVSESKIFQIRLKPVSTWSYFHGHFPSLPILPAVGIADISRYFAETYLLKTC
jgi:3-hydroxymyristoyl/3-hydroxydecanoyl-(acyl carrier protein) dehydratase